MNPEIGNGRSRRCRGSGRQHGSADRGEARKSAGVGRAGHASKGLPTNLGSLLASTETRGEKGQPDKQRALGHQSGRHEPNWRRPRKETANTNKQRAIRGTSQAKETKRGRTGSR
jgi:hypothetical protein